MKESREEAEGTAWLGDGTTGMGGLMCPGFRFLLYSSVGQGQADHSHGLTPAHRLFL